MGQFKRGPMDVGFSQTPHGLWTLNVSAGARLLLGWLHSHDDTFLAKVTTNRARKQFGTSTVPKWLNELEEAGFITIERGGPGSSNSYELLAEPWVALFGRRQMRCAETGSVASATSPKPARYRAGTGAPKPARIEEQGQEIRKNTVAEATPPKGAVAVRIWQAMYDDTKARTGKKLVAPSPKQMPTIVAPFLEGDAYTEAELLNAALAVHRGGRTLTRQTLQVQLDGRVRTSTTTKADRGRDAREMLRAMDEPKEIAE